MKKSILLSTLVFSIATGLIAQNTNPWPSTGSVGNNPANTIGAVSEIANFSGISPNFAQFKFLLKRHALNGGWENVSSRLQFITDVTNQGYIEFNPKDAPHGMALGSGNIENIRLRSNGNVGIGTINPGSYKLAVEGTIGARRVKVTTASWADYVFEKDYHLPSLAEVEQYIQQHKHLPDVPSAAEVEKNGLDIGDNQAMLLKKIEELTLYIIAQDKENKKQQNEIEKLRAESINLQELQNKILIIQESIDKIKKEV